MFKKLKRWLKRSLLARLWRERRSRIRAQVTTVIAIEKYEDLWLRHRQLASRAAKIEQQNERLERRNAYLEMSLGKKQIPNELPRNFE